VEAVTAVVNLAEPLCCIFLILAYLVMRPHFLSDSPSGSGSGSLSPWLRVSLWVALVTVATLIKETGIIAVVFVWSLSLVLLFHSLFGRQGKRETEREKERQTEKPSPAVNERQRQTSGLKDARNNAPAVSKEREKEKERESPKPNESRFRKFLSLSLFHSLPWNLLGGLLVYFYFAVRSVLVHPDRDRLLREESPWTILTKHILLYYFQLTGQDAHTHSYLNSSQLLRKAENHFAFLTGDSKALSMLVSEFVYVLSVRYNV
jgi:hypothetical protein